MTGNERPDIYADGLREERCENCLHCCATVLRTVHGVERTEYECGRRPEFVHRTHCLLYTSDAADEEDSVELGGLRILKKKKK